MGLASEGASRTFQPFHFSDLMPNMDSSNQKPNQNSGFQPIPSNNLKVQPEKSNKNCL